MLLSINISYSIVLLTLLFSATLGPDADCAEPSLSAAAAQRSCVTCKSTPAPRRTCMSRKKKKSKTREGPPEVRKQRKEKNVASTWQLLHLDVVYCSRCGICNRQADLAMSCTAAGVVSVIDRPILHVAYHSAAVVD